MEEYLHRFEVEADYLKLRNPVGYRVAFMNGDLLYESSNGAFITQRDALTSPPKNEKRAYYQVNDILFEAELTHEEARRLFPYEFGTTSDGFMEVLFFLFDSKIKVGWQIDELVTVNQQTYDGVCQLKAVIIDEDGKNYLPILHPKLVFVNRKALHSFFDEMDKRAAGRQFLSGYRWTVEMLLTVATTVVTAGGSAIASGVAKKVIRNAILKRLLKKQFTRITVRFFYQAGKLFGLGFIKSLVRNFTEVKSRGYNKRKSVGEWIDGQEFGEILVKAINESLHSLLESYIRDQKWLKEVLDARQLNDLKRYVAAVAKTEISTAWISAHKDFWNKILQQFFVDEKLTERQLLKILEDNLISMKAVQEQFIRRLEESLH